jgi:phosphoribosylanthranilate isomerase
MPVMTKICGVSTPDTLDAAVKGGASHIGFVFFAKSPRHISTDQARALVSRLPRHVLPVALVVDELPERIQDIRIQTGIHIVQLHGKETPAFASNLGGEIWKALPVKTATDLTAAKHYRGAVTRLLYDAKPPTGAPLPGGTGCRFDWTLLEGIEHPLPWILAGGLDHANISEAVRVSKADFVDISSGVESAPGIKDVDKIAAFLKATSQL